MVQEAEFSSTLKVAERIGNTLSEIRSRYAFRGALVRVPSVGGAGQMKASLHKSGLRRVAFTDVHAGKPETLVPDGRDRAFQKRNRPEEFAPGITRAFVVVFPWIAPVEYDEPYTSKEPILWLGPVLSRALLLLRG